MLAWGRQENESARAFQAFEVYRDLGVERSLVKVGQTLGKSRALIERWSAQHDWVDRVEALADRDEMLRREAVEEHVREGAEDRAKREAALLDRGLAVRELAMTQAEKMVGWPLAEQRVVREGPDGEDATYVFMPAGWSKAPAVSMFNMAIGNARADAPADDSLEFDFSGWDEDDLIEFMRLSERLTPRRKSDGSYSGSQ
jgi:hypothetical protein